MNPTPAEVASFADHMAATGVPAEEIAVFRQQFEPGQGAEPGGPPAETDAQLEPQALALMEQGATPPENPAAYELPWQPGDGLVSAEVREFDGMARQMLQHAGMPAAEGSTLARAINDAASRAQGWSDAEFELAGRNALAQLRGAWGSETNAKLELARTLVRELDAQFNGQLTAILETGAGSDAAVIMQLAHHAERRAALAKARGAKR